MKTQNINLSHDIKPNHIQTIYIKLVILETCQLINNSQQEIKEILCPKI